MKTLKEYIAAVNSSYDAPKSGDTIDIIVNEELSIECEVVELHEDGMILNLDDVAISILEQINPMTELDEAKYQGREVKLGKPMKGDVKKFKVYVKDPKSGNVKKVNFGSPDMEIKRDDPKRRKNFRARHGCGTSRASDRTKAAYWSCRMWSAKPVSKILKGK